MPWPGSLLPAVLMKTMNSVYAVIESNMQIFNSEYLKKVAKSENQSCSVRIQKQCHATFGFLIESKRN